MITKHTYDVCFSFPSLLGERSCLIFQNNTTTMKTYNSLSNVISARNIILLLSLLVLVPFDMSGKITFAYDAAGNRIKRELVITQMNKAPGNTAGVNEDYYDSIGEKSVTLTSDGSGIVQIKINDFNEEDTGRVSVYSINGIHVLDQQITECYLSIDMSSSPAGVYILTVTINRNQTTWKITKK